MHWVGAAMALGLLAGCGAHADVTGTIDGKGFDNVKAVYHGGPFLFFFDRDFDCIDTAFISRSYIDGEPPLDTPFVALQFGIDGEGPYVPSTYSVEGDSPITTYGLDNTGGDFNLIRAREGTLTIESVSPNHVEGSFDISFTEDHVSGTFRTEYCRNMQQ
jgi:hypothetical protein